jgi:DNA-binding Lrp family transcriptional regulator
MRDIASAVGITERPVQQIVRELVNRGYVDKEKLGRMNRYRVRRCAHLRHPLEADVDLGSLVELVPAHRRLD